MNCRILSDRQRFSGLALIYLVATIRIHFMLLYVSRICLAAIVGVEGRTEK